MLRCWRVNTVLAASGNRLKNKFLGQFSHSAPNATRRAGNDLCGIAVQRDICARFDMVSTFANASNDRWLLHLKPSLRKARLNLATSHSRSKLHLRNDICRLRLGAAILLRADALPFGQSGTVAVPQRRSLCQSLRGLLSMENTTSEQRSAHSQHLRDAEEGLAIRQHYLPVALFKRNSEPHPTQTQLGGIR